MLYLTDLLQQQTKLASFGRSWTENKNRIPYIYCPQTKKPKKIIYAVSLIIVGFIIGVITGGTILLT